MSSRTISRPVLCFAAAVTISGCGGSKEPKIPLNQAQARTVDTGGTVAQGAMAPEAQAALDSGNRLYRAKDYDRALEQYRRSAQLAPSESAPLVGILMVADVTKNSRLADSTLARMKALTPATPDSGAAMTEAEILRIHSGATKAPAPPGAKKD